MNMQSSRNPLRPQIVAEASAWFIEFRTDNPSASVRNRFDEWLRHSPEHIQAYLEVAAAWADLPMSDPEGCIDVQALIDRACASREEDVVVLQKRNARAQAASPSAQLSSDRPRSRLAIRGLAAAVVLLSVLVGYVAWLVLEASETYVTGVGEQRTIALADHSTVELNARSSIRIRFSQGVRAVELTEGQAQFHVAKDKQRPFLVRTDGLAVRAVGTRFDVYRKRTGTVVTVIEGRVAVISEALGRRTRSGLSQGPSASTPLSSGTQSASASTSGDGSPQPTADAGAVDTSRVPRHGTAGSAQRMPIFLSTGEQLTATALHISSPHRADLNAATAWVQRRLVFEETPLAEVAEEFNRYSARRLIVADSKLAALRISGVYSSADPAALIGFLRAQPNLQVIETEQEFRVIRGEPH